MLRIRNAENKQPQNSNRSQNTQLPQRQQQQQQQQAHGTTNNRAKSADPVRDAMEAIQTFENEQMSYSFNTCPVCNECRLEMKMSRDKSMCHRCQQDKNHVKMFSKENLMDPGYMPEELKDLTLVEQQLICRLAPAISLHMLKHGGLAAKGHCVTFPQSIDEPAQIFPRLPEEINIIKVRKKGKSDTSKDFVVRRYRVQHALEWLKMNNPAYRDIQISAERLAQLPIDGELHNGKLFEFEDTMPRVIDMGPAVEQLDLEADVPPTHSSVLLPETPVDIRQQVENTVRDVIGPNHGEVTKDKRNTVTIPWPTQDLQPISEFTTVNFFTMSFPTLFPHGTADFHINRPITCQSMSDWAEHLLWYRDGRFAQHHIFKFVVHNMIMRKRTLEQSRYIVQQQLGDAHMTVQELQEMIERNDDSIAKKVLYFGASLRGSSQYWAQRSKELTSLIQHQINEGHGLPSF